MALEILNPFVPKLSSCSEILNAGSQLLVAPLRDCALSPTEYTVEADAAVAINDISATLVVAAPTAVGTSVTLRKGSRLTFGTSVIVIAEDAVVGLTPVAVAIEPAAAAVAANATAITYGMLSVLSATNIPIDNQSTMVNRTDLQSGIQGSEVKTKIMMTSQIEIITRPDDRAFWQVMFPAAQNNDDIFALIIRGQDQRHAWGRAKVANLTDPGQIEEINRVTVSINFQAPYANPTLFRYLGTSDQTVFNGLRSRAGLLPLV